MLRDIVEINGAENAALWSEELRSATPQEILAWAVAKFGDRLGLASSFGGVSGHVLMDMAVKIRPDIQVFGIDTDFLSRNYETRDKAIRKYGITPLTYRPKLTPEEQAARYGERLWETIPTSAALSARSSQPARAGGTGCLDRRSAPRPEFDSPERRSRTMGCQVRCV